jgi:hypothetical protein
MTLESLRDALLEVTQDTNHFEAFQKPDRYIVWAEDGQADAVWADNQMDQQSITGTVDFFTKTENDPMFQQIQEKLNSLDLSWRLNSIQFEDETRYLHYEWVWELWLE